MVVGTARYLAPEQVDGRDVDERVDIYSLGLVLYEMLCGKAPFEADTDIATAVARLTTPPRPIRLECPAVPPGSSTSSTARSPRTRPTAGRARCRSATRWHRSAPTPTARRRGRPDDAGPAPAPATPRSRPRRPPAAARAGRAPRASPLHPGPGRPLDRGLRDRGVRRLSRATGRSTTSRRPTPRRRPRWSGRSRSSASRTTTPRATGTRARDQVEAVRDDNPATMWSTELYKDRDVGGLKSGVGLVIDLGAPKKIERRRGLTSPDSDWSAQVYASDTVPPTPRRLGAAALQRPGLGHGRAARADPSRRRPATCCSGSRTCRRAGPTGCAWPRSASLAPPDPLRTRDDATLAQLAAAGDRDALDVLLDRHVDRVHAICRRILGNPDDALDASQEALIAVARSIHRFDGRVGVHHLALPRRDQRRARRAAAPPAAGRRPGRDAARAGEPAAPAPGPRPRATARHRRRARPDPRGFPGRGRAARPLRPRLRPDRRGARACRPGTVRSRIARGRAALAVELGPTHGSRRTGNRRPAQRPTEHQP